MRLRAGKRIVDLQSELIAAREQLRVEASTDPLTGLLNRNAIFKVMHRDVFRAKREGTHLAVALLDIDHFKKVNDTYGHKAGDHVLRHVADCMAGLLRPYDALARFGGEEFLTVSAQLLARRCGACCRSLACGRIGHTSAGQGPAKPCT